MAAIREAGLRIPEDIAVAGFDDVPMARYVSPALTTVGVRIAELGKAALEQLMTQIEGRHDGTPHAHIRMPADLMIRASSSNERSRKT